MDSDFVEGVDPRAEALRHAPAVRRLDHRVDVDLAERYFVRELESHHHHPSDPEEDDLPRRGEERSRIERLELRGLVRPSEDGEWPERGAEPGVEHVRLPPQLTAAGAAARRGLLGDVGLLAR